MYIYWPEVKKKDGEALSYRFEGTIPTEGGNSEEALVVINARSSGNQLIIEGSMEVLLNTECSRCLKSFEHTLKADFNEVFIVLPGEVYHEDAKSLALEAANQLTVRGNYLYLDEYLRQVFLLFQNSKPLCREDCRGLCQICGVDHNVKSCECTGEHLADFRLRKLQELLPQQGLSRGGKD